MELINSTLKGLKLIWRHASWNQRAWFSAWLGLLALIAWLICLHEGIV